MTTMSPVSSIESIDLARHGVIQASAGTGKTYTIVALAVRILRTTTTPIDRLLMITFTEKAAGEMRHRLRVELERALGAADQGSPERQRILDALDSFGQARISTIHSFCGRLLQEHAFEGGQLLSTAIEDEAALLEELATGLIRRWGSLDEQLLEFLLRSSVRPRWAGNVRDWVGTVTRQAALYTPEAGDRLVPAPEEDAQAAADQIRAIAKTVRGHLEAIRGLLPEDVDPAAEPQVHPLSQALDQIGDRGPTRVKSLLNWYVHPLLSLLASRPEEPMELVEGAQALLSGIRRETTKNKNLTDFIDRPFDQLHGRLKDGWRERGLKLEEIADELARMDEYLSGQAIASLASNTIRDLHEALKTRCRERGIMTFSRMIAEVHDGIARGGPEGPLATALRESLDFVIVDEFQDTDRLQWEILQTALLSGYEPAPRVYIVGDPKQAIYGFRGADIHSYMAACEHLLEHCGAVGHSLGTNYRARPAVIEACNWLFGRSDWFDPKWPVTISDAGPAAKIQAVGEPVDGAGMVLVKLAPESASPARRAYARYVAERVDALCPRDATGRPTITFRGGAARPVDYSDFCILVRTRREARFYIEALRDKGIPFTFYKEPGLWASDEALQLHALFRALADPADVELWRSALISRFVSATPVEAVALAECPDTHPARRVFNDWVNCAERRDWPSLFRQILDASPILLDDMDEAPMEWERRLTNYRHLCQILEGEATRGGWDLFDLLAAIADRRSATQVSEDENLLRIETSEPKVQIMTMHACKGLEFPFVFVGGGFTMRPAGMPVQRRYERSDGGNGHWVIDLTANGKDTDADAEAELRRLYYVAITRAAVQVHIPVYTPGGRSMHSSGPLVWIVGERLERARAAGVPDSVREIDWPDRGLYRPRPSLPYEAVAEGPEEGRGAVQHGPGEGPALVGGIRRPPTNLQRLTVPTASYTSLVDRHARGASAEGSWLRLDDDRDEGYVQADLPGGAGVGQFFHKALEALVLTGDIPASLEDAGLPATLITIARNWVPARWLNDGFIAASLELIRRALTADLPGLGPIAGLGARDVLPELPFLYPVELFPDGAPGTRVHSGLLVGVIDLVARKDERYYILDWKSNRLADYGPDGLNQAMDANDYHLQYTLYTVALDRWLRARLGQTYDPRRHLGGVLYVFIRGLTEDGQRGVYVRDESDIRPTEWASGKLPGLIEEHVRGDADGR